MSKKQKFQKFSAEKMREAAGQQLEDVAKWPLIGLDMVQLENIGLDAVDFKKIRGYDKITVSFEDKGTYVIDTSTPESDNAPKEDGYRFRPLACLCVSGEEDFEQLIFQRVNRKGKIYLNGEMTLKNCPVNIANTTVTDLIVTLEKIKALLYYRFGILIDIRSATIKYMEINTTFQTIYPFDAYRYVLTLFMNIMPVREDKISRTSRSEKFYGGYKELPETFVRGNNRVSRKIYDKRKELRDKDKVDVPIELMRIEIALRTKQAVQDALGTAYLFELTTEHIVQYFKTQYEKLLVDPFDRWQEQCTTQLAKLIEYFRCSGHPWQRDMLEYCRNLEQDCGVPVFLDMDDIKRAIYRTSDRNGHRSRMYQSFLRIMLPQDRYSHYDNAKVTEIFSALQRAYENTRTYVIGKEVYHGLTDQALKEAEEQRLSKLTGKLDR